MAIANEQEPGKDTYRIIEFSAENFKRLRMVGFRPKGRITKITGKNDNGKTSVLDAVSYAFGGKKAAPEMPMRRGATKMEITLDLGRLTVRRTGTRLEVTPAKGEKAWNTPQAMLDSIYDELAFNPQEFALMKAEDQAEALRKLTGIEDELRRLDKASGLDYAARTPINADVKRLQAEIAGMVTQDNLPKEKVDEDAIRARKREANEANRNIVAAITEKTRLAGQLAEAEQGETRHMALIADTRVKIPALDKSIEDLTLAIQWLARAQATTLELMRAIPECADSYSKVVQIKERLLSAMGMAAEGGSEADEAQRVKAEEVKRLEGVLLAAEGTEQMVHDNVANARAAWQDAPAGEMVDTAALDEELENAQLINREIDKRAKTADLGKQLRDKQAEAQQLTRQIEDREEEKRQAIANAKMPLDGLSVGEKQVLYNGIPVKQLGEARQILLGVAIGIARDPALRLVLIPHGEALDEDALAELERMAEEKDFYVWMAKVDSSGKVGIYLEDGLVKENNEE